MEGESEGKVIALRAGFMNYAWGDPRFIPELFGVEASGEPFAEAWLGAHPRLSAKALVESQSIPLLELLKTRGRELLGEPTFSRYGGMPYLLKVLAAKRPLSIQVHPSREQARHGFILEEERGVSPRDPARRYHDDRHKPELFVAMTPFYALCGFRELEYVVQNLERVPELGAVLPGPWNSLEDLVVAYFRLQPEVRAPALLAWVERLRSQALNTAYEESDLEYWVLRTHDFTVVDSTPDKGLFFFLLLNLVRLAPGQGIFLPARVPHAYLSGAGLEVMANSDNVLRAGLTPKHVDVDELLAILSYKSWLPPPVEPDRFDEATHQRLVYRTQADEFQLELLELSGSDETISLEAVGPEVLFCVEGQGRVQLDDGWGDGLRLQRGTGCLVADATSYAVGGAGRIARVTTPLPEAALEFRGRAPTPLRFGTSGLRGLVTDITDLEAYVNVAGFLEYMVSTGQVARGERVAIAGDLRPSTDSPERSIMRAVAGAIVDSGFDVVNCGAVPTPALAHYAMAEGLAAIMVTGSHIPFDRNGIKFYKPSGEVLRGDEPAILRAIARARNQQYLVSAIQSPFDDDGMFVEGRVNVLPAPALEARVAYSVRFVDFFPSDALAGLTLAVYQHSAVGRDLICEVLEALGARVCRFGRTEEFVAVDTEAFGSDELENLQGLVDDVIARVGSVDAIVSTDGDSDRPLLLLVGEDGKISFVSGDVLGMVAAEYVGANAIAVSVTATDAIERHFTPRDVPVRRTKVGSPWVIEAMNESAQDRIVGWEANGGFVLGFAVRTDHGELAALPTRDALLPLLSVLHTAKLTEASLASVFARLPARFVYAAVVDVDPQGIQQIFDALEPGPVEPGQGELRFLLLTNEGSWQDRAGNTHPLSAELKERAEALGKSFVRYFLPERGGSSATYVDYLDGVRVYFDNDEVAHVRASGNAPQVRVYALAGDQERARQIVTHALGPEGIIEGLRRDLERSPQVLVFHDNIALTSKLLAARQGAGIIGTVSGSETAQTFWQEQLTTMRRSFGAKRVLSLYENLPVNQAFGLLLTWQRVKPYYRSDAGALMAFVFGEGTRSTPFTETDGAQKPAILSFVREGDGDGRCLSMVELSLRHFSPVEAYLRRSGFRGMVVKWGDELLMPARDLSGSDSLFADADVVRFVSMRAMDETTAENRDWVGVGADGHVTTFIPRRPLSKMQALAERGLIQRRNGVLYGGINLGSIAVSVQLLDALLDEFSLEINDPSADRRQRPDLDPQFFTALCIACIDDPTERQDIFANSIKETPAMAELKASQPQLLPRLRGVVEHFKAQHDKKPKLVAMDFGEAFWGDVGQHRELYAFYMSLNEEGLAGEVARALAGVPEERDADNNYISSDCELGQDVVVENSVLIDCKIQAGEIRDCVLVGTRAGQLLADQAFDVCSVVWSLTLEARSGSYRVYSTEPMAVQAGERLTTLFLGDSERVNMRVHEDMDLRDRETNYDVPVLGNGISFAEAHARMRKMPLTQLAGLREAAARAVFAMLEQPSD